MAEDPLSAALTLSRGSMGQVGVGRIALLEAIRDQGSINAAAKSVGLSYKAAWDAVQALNNLFDAALVIAHAGGASGGTSEVTELGKALIAAFRRVDAELGRAVGSLERRFQQPGIAPAAGFMWSLWMKTSARNALAGTVEAVTPGAVNAEVALDIGEGQSIVSIITRESVDELGLAPGRRAIALIKSSFVILVPGAEPVRSSARNCLAGTIVRREDGAVNSEIVLALSPAKTLTAVVTRESAERLALDVGSRASALVKASHVILVLED